MEENLSGRSRSKCFEAEIPVRALVRRPGIRCLLSEDLYHPPHADTLVNSTGKGPLRVPSASDGLFISRDKGLLRRPSETPSNEAGSEFLNEESFVNQQLTKIRAPVDNGRWIINETADNPLFSLRYFPPEPSTASATPHSHSIIFGYRNQLNSKNKFFLSTVKSRRVSRQIFLLLISKGNLRDSDSARLRPLSLSIGRSCRLNKSSTLRHPAQKDRRVGSSLSPRALKLTVAF